MIIEFFQKKWWKNGGAGRTAWSGTFSGRRWGVTAAELGLVQAAALWGL